MVKRLIRYRYFIILAIVNTLLFFLLPKVGIRSFKIEIDSLKEMAIILPPIFILLGLIDIWVEKETMIKFMGEGSGFYGMGIAFLLGSAAAGPLYAAFPIACVLLKKEAKLLNVIVFIGAWSNTKIPMLLFEISSMGWVFMLTRLIVNIIGIALTAFILEKFIKLSEKKSIYQRASNLE